MRQEDKLSENYYEWSRQFHEEQKQIKERAHAYSQQRIKEIDEKVKKEAEEKRAQEEKERKASLWVCLGIAFGIPALVLLVPNTGAGTYLMSLLTLTTVVPIIPILIGISLAIITSHYKKKKEK